MNQIMDRQGQTDRYDMRECVCVCVRVFVRVHVRVHERERERESKFGCKIRLKCIFPTT